MKKEWMEYYIFLENLRKSGVTNMFGAAPYLQDEFGIEHGIALEILKNWMKNYDKIMKTLKEPA